MSQLAFPRGCTPLSRRRAGVSGGFITLLLCLCLAACGDADRYKPLPPGSLVLAFGDSVTYGTGAPTGEDYPTYLWKLTDWGVVNAGIPGDRANTARGRLPALLRLHQPDLVIIELGGNDFLRKRPERQVKDDLEVMIRVSQESGAVTALVAVPRLSLLRASTGTLKDSDIYAELAEETGAILIPDVFSNILSDDSLKADEIHPNGSGYQVLAQGIADRLAERGLLNR